MKTKSSGRARSGAAALKNGKSPQPGCGGAVHWQLSQAVRHMQALQDAALASHAIDLRGYAALLRLKHVPCTTQLQLAHQSAIDKSTMVGVLDKLAEADLVQRTPDPRDRRARIITLTPKGEAKLAAAQLSVATAEQTLLTHLDAADRAAFAQNLARLAEALVAHDPGAAQSCDGT